MEVLLANKLTEVAALEAPKVRLSFRPLVGHFPKNEIERGTCDLAMAGYFDELPPGFYQQKILQDPFVLVMRKDHPLKRKRKKLSLDQILSYSFVLISTKGDLVAQFDRKLTEVGKSRHIALAVPNSMSALWAVAHSDHLLVASQHFVREAQRQLPITTCPLPMLIEPIRMLQVWHQRTHKDPLRQWLRKNVYEILSRRL